MHEIDNLTIFLYNFFLYILIHALSSRTYYEKKPISSTDKLTIRHM